MQLKQKLKNQRGITLIALVITIVVLIILATVTINIVINGGLFSAAREARLFQANAEEYDKEKIEVAANGIQEYIGTLIGDGSEAATLPSGTYTVGQEITFGNEQFFVIADNGNSVKLLAKYCLNREGTSQETAYDADYGRPFSNTCYWSDTDQSEYINLQSADMISLAEEDGDADTGVPNAVLAAINYGNSKGAEGRLLSFEELDEIQQREGSDERTLLWNELCGHWDDDYAYESGCMTFWLGTAYNHEYTWYVDGNVDGWCYYSQATGPEIIGVRPILIVQKN